VALLPAMHFLAVCAKQCWAEEAGTASSRNSVWKLSWLFTPSREIYRMGEGSGSDIGGVLDT